MFHALQHSSTGEGRISICVRKRPISSKEVARRDFDSVRRLCLACASCSLHSRALAQITVTHPRITIHACKLKVDGITKFLENTAFQFDHVREVCPAPFWRCVVPLDDPTPSALSLW